MFDLVKVKVEGFLTITDKTNNKILLEIHNDVHPENLALSLVQSLGGFADGPILTMAFGTGGAVINAIGEITYLSKNITGMNATLYNQTYSKIISNNSVQNIDPSNNYVQWNHVAGNLFSDLTSVCTLNANEPSFQPIVSNATTLNNDFTFNEIALVNSAGLLLSHVIFAPIQKSASIVLEILYVLRVILV